MRLAIAFAALITFAGIGSTANASCEKCPNGYSFWHSKDACLADDGSGATAQPLYWKEDPPGRTRRSTVASWAAARTVTRVRQADEVQGAPPLIRQREARLAAGRAFKHGQPEARRFYGWRSKAISSSTFSS
jgi:hypothetical protein